MPTIDKCTKCGRKGGYGKDTNKAVCMRCENNTDDTSTNDDNQN